MLSGAIGTIGAARTASSGPLGLIIRRGLPSAGQGVRCAARGGRFTQGTFSPRRGVMKTLIFSASVAAFTMLVDAPVPALAQVDVEKTATIKCEWQRQAPGHLQQLSARACKKVRNLRHKLKELGGTECGTTKPGTQGQHWL